MPIGSLIHVSVGDTRFDGLRVVTGSSNDGTTKRAISFDEVASATVTRAAANGTISVVKSKRITPLTAQKVGATVTLTFAAGSGPTPPGSFVYVGGINPIDSYAMINAPVTESTDTTIKYTQTLNNGASSTSMTNPSLVVIDTTSPEPNHHLIKTWNVDNTGENDFTTLRTLDWSWAFPQNINAQTVRFAWVLEFEEVDSGTFATSQEFTIILDNLEAWPGSADTSTDNTWTDEQEFKAPVEFKDAVHMQSTLTVDGDVTVDPGDIYLRGARVLPPGETFFYTLDYPRRSNAGASWGSTGVHAIVNSLVAADPITVSSDMIEYEANWSGQFTSTLTDKQWLFTLWRFVYTDLSNPSLGGEWKQLRTVSGTAANVDSGTSLVVGASISHSEIVTSEEMTIPTFMVTSIRSGTGGALTTIYDSTSPTTLFPNNRLTVKVSAYDREPIPTVTLPTYTHPESAGVTFSYTSNSTPLAPATDANWADSTAYLTRDAARKIKVIKFTGGTKKCYRGDGVDLANNDLLQSYWNDQGNHKVAWFLQGANANATGTFISPRILECYLDVIGGDFNSDGVAVIGTHNDNTVRSQYGNIVGKSPNRRTAAMNRNGVVTRMDLGTAIGAELWNGPLNASAGAGSQIAQGNNNQSFGILLGPAPEQWARYKGSFRAASFELYLTIEYG